MNIQYQGLFVLIKSALTGQKLPLLEGFVPEEADELIRSQSLVPLIYRGAFNCGVSPKSAQMQKYQMQYFQHLIQSDKQMRAVERICGAFDENNIDYMPLKGCNMKKLYPRPEMRSMGDADILIRDEQYGKIRPIMRQLGYEEVKESPYDYCWNTPELYAELHKRLFAPSQAELYRWFGDGWSKAHQAQGSRYEMSREDEYVYVFTHMAKHFRFTGIGVRHLVDLYVYRRAYPDLNEAIIEEAMTGLRLLDFYRNIRRTLDAWFEGGPSDTVTELITQRVFTSGSFGTMANKLYAEELLKDNKKDEVKGSKFKTLLAALFPPLDLMQLSYNVLYKWPILYPFFWPVRWVEVLLRRRGNISKKMRIIRDMSDDKVQAHRKAMNLMGLDFDYGEEE